MASETVVLDLPAQHGKPFVAQGGRELFLSPSVYDVPQSATIEWNGVERLLRVTFKYVDNESADERRVNDLTFYTGTNSQKMLGLSLRVRAPDERITDELAQRINQQIAGATRDNQRLNYAIVRDVLAHTLAPLLKRMMLSAAR